MNFPSTSIELFTTTIPPKILSEFQVNINFYLPNLLGEGKICIKNVGALPPGETQSIGFQKLILF
jgi:hypothetical protein